MPKRRSLKPVCLPFHHKGSCDFYLCRCPSTSGSLDTEALSLRAYDSLNSRLYGEALTLAETHATQSYRNPDKHQKAQ